MKRKGLLKKDILVICLQMKAMLLVSVIFVIMAASMNNAFMLGFSMLFAAALPISVLAYDEQCRWDLYALAIRYSRKDIVVSKYQLQLMLLIGFAVLYSVIRFPVSLFAAAMPFPAEIALVTRFTALSFLYAALVLPFSFALGTAKARLVNLLVMGCMAGGLAGANIHQGFETARLMETSPFLGIPFLLFTVILFLISRGIAVKAYQKRKL